MRNPKLKPWLDAGLKKVALEGVTKLNISEISHEVEIAKSSFYHYFNTKEEYLEQLIDYCEELGTTDMIKDVFLETNLTAPVQFIINQVFDQNFQIECALQQFRTSVGKNEMLKKKIEDIEKIRISFLSALLARSGFENEEANTKARQIYRFFLGTLVHNNLKKPNEKEKEIIIEDFLSLFGEV